MATRSRRGRIVQSQQLILAAAAVWGVESSVASAQVTIDTSSSSTWIITDGPLVAQFNTGGDEISNITYNGGPDLLRPGGGTSGSLDEEFAGTPFKANSLQTSHSFVGVNNSYVDVWTDVPSGGTNNNPIDYQFHYVLFNNDPTIYAYEVVNHASTDPTTSIGQGQFLFRGNASLFPNLYQQGLGPNNTGSQLTINMPSTASNYSTVTTPTGTAVQNATSDLTGSTLTFSNGAMRSGQGVGDNGSNFFTKYDYSTYSQFFQAETMYGTAYSVTQLVPSTELMSGGPTKQVLAWTDPAILNMEFLSDHYGIDGPGMGAYPGYGYYPGQGNTSRFFGIYGFAIGATGTLSGAQINQNAINNIPSDIAEFDTDQELIASGYTPSTARGTFQITATNSAGWSANTVNNTVVLSEPNVNMQESTQGYQYWTQLSSGGAGAINSVAPGTYRMTLYQLGQWGETRVDGVNISALSTTTPTKNTFTPENFGTAAPIWTIGTPNRSSNEFMNGHTATGADLREYSGAYNFWAEEAALGNNGFVSYYATAVGATPATNDPNKWIANQWYLYDPGLYDANNNTTDGYNSLAPAYVNSGGGPSKYHGLAWQVHFTATAPQLAQGQYVVVSVAAAALDDNLTLTLNGHAETWNGNKFAPDDPQIRSGAAGFLQWAAFEFPTTDLNAAGVADLLTFGLTSTGASTANDGVMYDSIRMEITNTSAAPTTTGWYDYTYINSSTSIAPNDAIGLPAQDSVWNLAAGGDWGTNPDWLNSFVPHFTRYSADFTSAITTASTINLNTNWTVGTVYFNNTNSYTLAPNGTGSITMDNAPTSAAIIDDGGSHFITAPITLNNNVLVKVTNAGDNLTISGAIGGAGGITLTGAGTFTLNAVNNYAGPTAVNSGLLVVGVNGALPVNNPLTIGTNSTNGRVRLAVNTHTTTFTSLTINTGSTLDIANNTLAVNFVSPATDPVATIVGNLTTGYAGGNWSGAGINSSTAATGAPGLTLSVGYADGNIDAGTPAAANQILVKYTLAGDANLDGLVNFGDLVAVIQNFNKPNTDWAQGNFSYGASTNFGDLVAVIQNFNKTLNPAGSSGDELGGGSTIPLIQSSDVQLPEPGAIALLAAGALGLLKRRRQQESLSDPSPTAQCEGPI